MAVACGRFHTLVVGERGLRVFACGRGVDGQLGTGTHDDQRVPAPVARLPAGSTGARIDMVAAGGFHSAAITSAGELFTWGFGSLGELGHGDEDHRAAPAALELARFGGSPVAMVACGQYHTLVVTAAGVLFAFGCGEQGQLGLGDKNNRLVPAEVGRSRFGGARITCAAAGYYHSGAVTLEGRVYTWGYGGHGGLGHCDEEEQLVPRELAGQFGGRKAVMLAAGDADTMTVTEDGAVWACGYGGSGQLGVGDTDDRLTPVRVGAGPAFGECKVRMVACGAAHTAAVTEEGGLWTGGEGDIGRLGPNDERNRLEPERVGAGRFGGGKIVTADCGAGHTAAVTEEGALYTWGAESCMHLGGFAGRPRARGPGGQARADPRRTRPPGLGGARVGRWLPLSRLHTLAVAMGVHCRLGGGAAIHALAGKESLVQMVVEACRDWPEGPAGEEAGVEGLVGASHGKIK